MSFENAFYELVMQDDKSKEESLELFEKMLSSWKGEIAGDLLVTM